MFSREAVSREDLAWPIHHHFLISWNSASSSTVLFRGRYPWPFVLVRNPCLWTFTWSVQCCPTHYHWAALTFWRQVKIQESIISHQAKLLPAFGDTIFSIELLRNRPTLFQKHCETITDFLLPGENHWWSFDGKHIIFHDGPSRPDSCGEPMLQHFHLTTSEKQDTILQETFKIIHLYLFVQIL